MSMMKSFWMDESHKLALNFQQYLSSKGIDTEPDFDGAESVLMHKVPEADSYWDLEWKWVESRIASFVVKQEVVKDIILTTTLGTPMPQ